MFSLVISFVYQKEPQLTPLGLVDNPKNKTYFKKTNPKGSSFFQNDGVCVRF